MPPPTDRPSPDDRDQGPDLKAVLGELAAALQAAGPSTFPDPTTREVVKAYVESEVRRAASAGGGRAAAEALVRELQRAGLGATRAQAMAGPPPRPAPPAPSPAPASPPPPNRPPTPPPAASSPPPPPPPPTPPPVPSAVPPARTPARRKRAVQLSRQRRRKQRAQAARSAARANAAAAKQARAQAQAQQQAARAAQQQAQAQQRAQAKQAAQQAQPATRPGRRGRRARAQVRRRRYKRIRQKAEAYQAAQRILLSTMPRPIAQGFAAALQATAGWKQLGTAFQGMAGAGGMIARLAPYAPLLAAGIPVGLGTAALAAGRYAAVNARRDAEGQNASNRQHAAFSPALTTEFMRASLRQTYRDIESSRALTASAVGLSRSVDQMRAAWLPVDIMRQDVGNRVGSIKANVSEGLATVLNPVAEMYNRLSATLDPSGQAVGRGVGAAAAGLFGNLLGGPFGGANAVNQFLGAPAPAAPLDPLQGQLDRIANVGKLAPRRNLRGL